MSVVAKDVFVPEYKALGMLDARGGDKFPGAKTNPNPAYCVPLSALGGHGIGACAVATLRPRSKRRSPRSRSAAPTIPARRCATSRRCSCASARRARKIDAARLVLRNDCLEAQEIANRRQIADVATKLRFKRNLAYAVGIATEAVDMLHAMAGANGIYETYPLERIFRDAHSLAGHISFSFDAQASTWGLAASGGEIVNPTL